MAFRLKNDKCHPPCSFESLSLSLHHRKPGEPVKSELIACWKAEDADQSALREQLNARAVALRASFEALQPRVADLLSAYREAEAVAQQRALQRRDAAAAHASIRASEIDTLYDCVAYKRDAEGRLPLDFKPRMERTDRAPHWLHALVTTIQVADASWTHAVANESPTVDPTTAGGKAIQTLLQAVTDTMALWRPMEHATGRGTTIAPSVQFNWDDFMESDKLYTVDTVLKTNMPFDCGGQIREEELHSEAVYEKESEVGEDGEDSEDDEDVPTPVEASRARALAADLLADDEQLE